MGSVKKSLAKVSLRLPNQRSGWSKMVDHKNDGHSRVIILCQRDIEIDRNHPIARLHLVLIRKRGFTLLS